jgi:hypothetical protein
LKEWLACGFCGHAIEWPFSSTTLAARNDPDIDSGVNQIIGAHFSLSKALDDLDFEECTHLERWTDTTWTRVDVDNANKVVATGRMVMTDSFPSATK